MDKWDFGNFQELSVLVMNPFPSLPTLIAFDMKKVKRLKS